MALARVQGTGKVVVDTAASVSVTFATPPTVGNGIVVLVTGYNNPSPGFTTCADNRGNVYTLAIAQVLPPASVEVAIYVCAAVTTTAAPFTVTVTGTAGTYWVASAVEVSGVGTGLTVDGTAGRAVTVTTPVGTGATAALTTSADTFLAAVLSVGGAEAAITVESVVPAWTQEHEELSFTHAVGEADTRVVTAAGGTTQACTWTISTLQAYSAALAAFKAASSSSVVSTYSNLVIADGASNYWRLNEPSGTTAVDIVGGKNGTISGGVTLNQAGALSDGDKAMTFNGTTGKILTGSTITVPVVCTVEMWTKTVSLAFQESFGLSTLDIGIGPNSGTKVYTYTGTIQWGTRDVGDGAWHHVVCVYPDAVTALLYVDGTLDATGASLRSAPSTSIASIGSSPASASFFNGSVDDVAIYPVALTAAQIAAHYTVGKIGKTAPTTYADRVILDGASNYWRLNEPSGTTAVDVIGGANGTISGGVTLNQPGALSDGDKAMTFNGTTGKIVTAATLSLPAACSAEFWLNTTTVVQKWFLSCPPDATYEIGIYSNALFAGSGSGNVLGVRAVNDGRWHHVVVVQTGTTCLMYIDATLDISGASTHVNQTTTIRIGFDFGSSVSYQGSIDEVAIYPVALTPAQIAAHYQARLLSGSRRPLPAFVLAHRRFPS